MQNFNENFKNGVLKYLKKIHEIYETFKSENFIAHLY